MTNSTPPPSNSSSAASSLSAGWMSNRYSPIDARWWVTKRRCARSSSTCRSLMVRAVMDWSSRMGEGATHPAEDARGPRPSTRADRPRPAGCGPGRRCRSRRGTGAPPGGAAPRGSRTATTAAESSAIVMPSRHPQDLVEVGDGEALDLRVVAVDHQVLRVVRVGPAERLADQLQGADRGDLLLADEHDLAGVGQDLEVEVVVGRTARRARRRRPSASGGRRPGGRPAGGSTSGR